MLTSAEFYQKLRKKEITGVLFEEYVGGELITSGIVVGVEGGIAYFFHFKINKITACKIKRFLSGGEMNKFKVLI